LEVVPAATGDLNDVLPRALVQVANALTSPRVDPPHPDSGNAAKVLCFYR